MQLNSWQSGAQRGHIVLGMGLALRAEHSNTQSWLAEHCPWWHIYVDRGRKKPPRMSTVTRSTLWCAPRKAESEAQGWPATELSTELSTGAQHPPTHTWAEPNQPHSSCRWPAPHPAGVQGWPQSWQMLFPLTGEFLGLITPLLLTEAHSTRANLQKQEAKKAGINTPTFPPGMLPPRCCLKKTNISLSRSVGKSYYKLRLTVSQITHQCRDQI